MSEPACPRGDILDAHFLGTLPASLRAEVDAHVSGCVACQQRAATLPAGAAADPPAVAPASGRPTVELTAQTGPLRRGTLVGRYVILQLLGSGAMGHVYEAVDPDLERKVALKLLKTPGGNAEARTRLLREAQAMARLSHPNVVQVFDVGTSETGDVFVAMERVDGESLSEWCGRQTDWRQILRYFLYAGRGLAAAHAAGFIHRDFKPHNVLVGKDGRVRVTDFGLARLVSDRRLAEQPDSISETLLGEPLTREGAIVGTPHYMSPEQLAGESVDARSDQFSFCVSLWAALFGERPFAGNRLHELLAQQMQNQLRDPPDGARVPAWLRRAISRGLRFSRDERYPDMAALFAALEKDPARRWRRAGVGAAAVLALAVAAGGSALALRAPSPCLGVDQPLRTTWSDANRDRIQAVFQKSKRPFAEGAFQALDVALNAYVASSAKTLTQTCRAARVQKTLPEATWAQHQACFAQRERDLAAFIALLPKVEPAALTQAATSLASLPTLESCTQNGDVPLRTTAEEALYPKELEQLSEALAQATAKRALGQFAAARDEAKAALKSGPHLRDAPISAELHRVAGLAESSLEQFELASADLEHAALLEERHGNDAGAARGWGERASLEVDLSHPKEAAFYLGLMRAKLDRLPAPPVLIESTWRLLTASLQADSGDYRGAAERLDQALAELGPALPPLQTAHLLDRIGSVRNRLGEYPAANRAFEKSVELTEAEVGPHHPMLVGRLDNLALAKQHEGDRAAARKLFDRALRISEETLEPGNIEEARVLNNLALLESDEGHEEKALALLRRSRREKTERVGPDHPTVAVAWLNEASSLVRLQRPAEAEAAMAEAARIFIASKGPDHPNLAAVYNNLGTLQRNEQHYDRAEKSFQEAVRIAEAKLGPKHPWLAIGLFGLGMNAISQDRFKDAAPSLERALAIDEAIGASETDVAEVRFALAEALWMTDRHQRRRALTLANDALEVGRRTPLPDGPTVADMMKWIRQHRSLFNAPRR